MKKEFIVMRNGNFVGYQQDNDGVDAAIRFLLKPPCDTMSWKIQAANFPLDTPAPPNSLVVLQAPDGTPDVPAIKNPAEVAGWRVVAICRESDGSPA